MPCDVDYFQRELIGGMSSISSSSSPSSDGRISDDETSFIWQGPQPLSLADIIWLSDDLGDPFIKTRSVYMYDHQGFSQDEQMGSPENILGRKNNMDNEK